MYENIIVIPFRDREEHLKCFINEVVPYIKKYMCDTKVLVVEQDVGKEFNRGKLLNVGFKEYENKSKFFFTHDVDIIPTESVVKDVYTKDVDIFRIFSAHDMSLGGIIKIKHDILFDINGFPNDIWGWGIEDRAIYFRTYIRKLTITNNHNKSFRKLDHKPNSVYYSGEKLQISNKWYGKHINTLTAEDKEKMITNSGLNNVEYKILKTEKLDDIVELIKVQI